MKKNAMLKIAAILLVAVLLTTCAVSSTFAKYSSAEATGGTNTATVAKWGVKFTAVEGDLAMFKASYDGEGDVSVATSVSDKFLVAPGTTNTVNLLNDLTIVGTPEVAFQLKAYADVQLSGWEVGAGYYCPLAITVGSVTYYGNDEDYEDADDFEAAVEEAIAKALLAGSGTKAEAVENSDDAFYYTQSFAPETNVATTIGTVNVTWEWAFEDDDENLAGIDDDNDTALGDAGNATIQISYGIGAEQIDTYTPPANNS